MRSFLVAVVISPCMAQPACNVIYVDSTDYTINPDGQGKNCYPGRGGDVIYGNDADEPLVASTLDECQSACEDTVAPAGQDPRHECAAVVFSPSSGLCWLRSNVAPENCEQVDSADFITTIRTISYPGLNCYEGHGGGPMDPSDTPDEVHPFVGKWYEPCVEACLAKDDRFNSCEGFVGIGRSALAAHNTCYYRSWLTHNECERGDVSAYSTYFLRTLRHYHPDCTYVPPLMHNATVII